MSNWETLEEFVKSLLKFDNPVRTPLSGGTKHEEDVVGTYTLSQCKFTSDKNISILDADMRRLILAASMMNRFPIFVSEYAEGKAVSIPSRSDTDPILREMLKLAVIKWGLNNLEDLKHTIKTPQILNKVDTEFRKLKKLFYELDSDIKTQVSRMENMLDQKHIDLTHYDLFEVVEAPEYGENNGSKQ